MLKKQVAVFVTSTPVSHASGKVTIAFRNFEVNPTELHSDSQYFLCDEFGFDFTSFATCETGVCNTSVSGSTPCTTADIPSCPEPPKSTIKPQTTTPSEI